MEREPENGLLELLENVGIGCIVYSPLAQGLLTDRYLNGIPADSRAAREVFLKKEKVEQLHKRIRALNELAQKRGGQSLAQMALSWLLKDERITSVLVGGASSVEQLENNINCLENVDFSYEELNQIETVLKS